jgi:RNA polymerase sigma-70 factor (ECF subfamily)
MADLHRQQSIPRSFVAASPYEAELISKAKLGDEDAFVELCERHRTSVLRVVTRITGNAEDAEDAVQDSIMKAFINLGGFDGRSKFSTWFTRIGINTALMCLRKRRRRCEMSLNSEEGLMLSRQWELVDKGPTPELACGMHERHAHLENAIRGLRPNLRSIVEIQISTDASLQDISVVAGITVAATKSRLLRARLNLRQTLKRRRQV